MKKLFIVLSLFMMILLTGCNRTSVEKQTDTVKETSMFISVETAMSWEIVYHRDTKVMYAVSEGSYNYGTFTVLVNADGTPMLYTEGGESK